MVDAMHHVLNANFYAFFYLKSESVPFSTAVIYMAIFTIVTFAVIGVGAYVFIRVLAGVINNRRDAWQTVADDLGFAVDQASGALNKNIVGTRDGRSVKVTKFSVQKSENSYDEYAAVEIKYNAGLLFSFKIERIEMFYQKIRDFFAEGETGHEVFDKAFRIETSSTTDLMELLNIEMLDGETPTLLNDLMAAQKTFHRVIVTDTSVCLGVKIMPVDSAPIERAVGRVGYLIKRIEQASNRLKV